MPNGIEKLTFLMDFSLQEKYERDMNDWKEAQLKELQVQIADLTA